MTESVGMDRINFVCLGVADMERSIRFYKDGLGFKTNEESYDPPVIFFKTGGTVLSLYPLDLLAEDIGGGLKPGTGFGGVTLAFNAKSKEEVREATERAREAGARVVKEPQDTFWGGYHAYFSDPDGHYWEIAYAPMLEFDENNMLVI